MSNVLVEKNKLDLLANAIAGKSGEPLKLTLDEMVETVDGIETGGGGITPTGNIDITQAGVTDVTNYATATVPQGEIYIIQPYGRFKTVSNVRKWEVVSGGGIEEVDEYGHAGYVADDTWENVTKEYDAIPTGTTITPTTSSQTIGGANYMMEGAVTVNAMPSMTLPSSTSATSSGTSKATISASSSTQYLNIPTGYNATAQYYTISASGGGSSTCDTKTITNSNDQATSIQFTGLSGQPKWFFVRCTSQLTRSSSYSYYYVTAVRYNGTNHYGNYWRRSNGTFYNDTTHYSHTYSNGTLTVSSSAGRGSAGGSFYNGGYELVYIY